MQYFTDSKQQKSFRDFEGYDVSSTIGAYWLSIFILRYHFGENNNDIILFGYNGGW